MTMPGEMARVTGLSRPEAGRGNRALVAEGYATMLAPGVYELAARPNATRADPNSSATGVASFPPNGGSASCRSQMAPAFNRKRDLHLLRGDPPIALWKLLDVIFESRTGGGSATFDAYRAQHDDVVIQLQPVFDFDEVGTRFVGSNIEIDQSTGMLRTLKPQPPEPAVHNFIIEAIVTKNGSAAVPKWSPGRLRVHVHQSVERIRMSPSRLSIRRPKATGDCNTNYGFTVRAEFDDGTSADITATSHYRADPIDAECFYDASEEARAS